MCYDVNYLLKKSEKYAEHFGVPNQNVLDIMKMSPPMYHVTGFDHPNIPVIANNKPSEMQLFEWGLIPSWVKDPASATRMSNSTLNARGETMFEKGSFKASAMYKRCIVVIDGFFEHHWYKGKSYPFYIQLKNGDPIPLAGLWENWRGKSTFSIVTTEGNPIMEKIHNNPKGSESHRMPAILPHELMYEWLQPVHDQLDQEKLLELLQPYDENEMEWHTVRRLRGKAYPGNVPEVLEDTKYEELVF